MKTCLWECLGHLFDPGSGPLILDFEVNQDLVTNYESGTQYLGIFGFLQGTDDVLATAGSEIPQLHSHFMAKALLIDQPQTLQLTFIPKVILPHRSV